MWDPVSPNRLSGVFEAATPAAFRASISADNATPALSKAAADPRAIDPATAVGPPEDPNGVQRWALRKPRRCFDAPKFSCSRCSRALLATFAGLTMWVGMWDLLDAHVLPTLVKECKTEPNFPCAVAKLGLIAVGACGLYCTRSLYGDSTEQTVHFQRIQ